MLSRLFTLAEVWGLRPDGSNPCRHVKRFREEKRERFLSDEEYRRLGSALKESEEQGLEPPLVVAAVRLLMLTGCRKSEILRLRWEHVDPEAGELRLPDSKTGAKIVHLGDPAIAVLRGIPGPTTAPGSSRGASATSRCTISSTGGTASASERGSARCGFTTCGTLVPRYLIL